MDLSSIYGLEVTDAERKHLCKYLIRLHRFPLSFLPSLSLLNNNLARIFQLTTSDDWHLAFLHAIGNLRVEDSDLPFLDRHKSQ